MHDLSTDWILPVLCNQLLKKYLLRLNNGYFTFNPNQVLHVDCKKLTCLTAHQLPLQKSIAARVRSLMYHTQPHAEVPHVDPAAN